LTAAALCIAVPAHSTTLHTIGWLAPPPDSFTVYRGTTHQGVPAGGFTGTFGGQPIVFWCYDLDHFFSFGNNYDYTAVPIVSLRLSQLFAEAYGSVAGNPHNSAAFQLAVWNILYDSDSTVSSGFFHATGNATAINQANTWLGGLKGNGGGWAITYLHSNARPESQNFITATQTSLKVPEPPTWALLLLTLALVAFVQTRGRKFSTRTR
jgi:hypothetical protein